MSRNNVGNIKKHNDKLHKSVLKNKKAVIDRKAKLKEIIKKHNKPSNGNE